MSKSIKELAEELFQYFEEGNEQGIVLLLNNCNRDKLLAKAYNNPQLNSQGTLLVNSEHFSNNESSMHNKAIELAKYIKQELWEKCVELATNNDDCFWGKHPTIKHAIKSQINKIESERETRELIADAMKEPEASNGNHEASESESELDDFEQVEAHEEDFEPVKAHEEGFVMVGKSAGTLDYPNASHMDGKSKDII